MRNISVILALALVAGASLSAQAAGKKDKKQGKKATTTVVKQPVALNTANDSLSYASGQALTRGMMDYVIAQLKVDTAEGCRSRTPHRQYGKGGHAATHEGRYGENGSGD